MDSNGCDLLALLASEYPKMTEKQQEMAKQLQIAIRNLKMAKLKNSKEDEKNQLDTLCMTQMTKYFEKCFLGRHKEVLEMFAEFMNKF